GLFIILSSAILIAVLFLILEHLAYHFVVPWLRKQPAESFWKTENLAFISQGKHFLSISHRNNINQALKGSARQSPVIGDIHIFEHLKQIMALKNNSLSITLFPADKSFKKVADS
ncbi:glutamate receptor ionotropic, NMDA 2B, partial [Biomphalaria glabrata]